MPSNPTTPGADTMPTFFIPHGAGPCFFMDWTPSNTWTGMAAFLKGLAKTLPRPPSAILLISGHWLEPEFSVTSGQHPDLLYDYHGFPQHTYELTYPAPGNPQLAERIAQLLGQAQISSRSNPVRGFDHGMFIPLKLMFPKADIPVVQFSLRQDLDPTAHLKVGEALALLREEGVLIIGSGMSFHNMRGYGDAAFGPLSELFDEWLTAAVESNPDQRRATLARWQTAPHAQQCHPPGGEEHLIPLLVAAGAGMNSPAQRIYSENVMKTRLSAYRFG